MMPLAMVSPGEEVRLVAIHGGQRLRKRLADLGLNLGMTVRVLQGDGHGPLILAVKDSRAHTELGGAPQICHESFGGALR
ncbi:MAG: ferrous iron transport protein A [Chloroflexi bacterium HGW-Chloroflexi-1]|nr:MAG: ferrous iron transport protein A [Chloroflexi bacterium HGW-Chloroflexi-1]